MTFTESQVANPVHLVPIKDIQAAPWNPASRVEERRLQKLKASIEDIGLLYPVLLDETKRLVDGHRRLSILKKMGWKHVPAITISSEFEHAYGSIQLNQEKLSGNDLIGVYLSNPKALLQPQRRKAERIEEECGRSSLELLYKSRLTPGTFDLAMRVVRYLEAKVESTKVLRWMVRHSMGSVIRHLLDAGVSALTLKRAIEDDRPLKVKLTARDE